MCYLCAGMRLKAKIYGTLLLVMFLGHLADASLFPHTHVVGGHIVAHSHLYTGNSDSPQHDHCNSQLVMIALLSTAVLAGVLFVLSVFLTARITERFVDLSERFTQRAEVLHNSLRGPPVPASFV